MKKKNEHLEGLMALLLFGVFAVCLLIVLLTGADSYQRLTERDQLASDSRTCAQYLTTRVRQAEEDGAVAVEEFGGGNALCFRQNIVGEGYVTRIYVHDGWLMELFCRAEAELEPADGERVMAAQSLEAEERDGLLCLAITPENGEAVEVLLSLRSGEGAWYEK
jgi:hypothetical protein